MVYRKHLAELSHKLKNAARPSSYLFSKQTICASGEIWFLIGALAQLGERLICIQEVIGSIPIGSTITAILA